MTNHLVELQWYLERIFVRLYLCVIFWKFDNYSVKDVRSGSGVTPEWKGFDNKMGITLVSAHVLCLDLLSRVWLHILGGLNCCQEFQRGMV